MSQYKEKKYKNDNSISNQQHYQNSRHSHVLNKITKWIKEFIPMEASTTTTNNTSRHQQSAANNPMRSTQRDIQVLHCFCNYAQLNHEQIKNVLMMNVNDILTNQISNKLFKTFLKIGHRSDKTNALLLVKCFELINKMLNDLSSYKEYFDDLIELCLSLLWEHRLEKACDASSSEEVKTLLKKVLKALKKECLCNIEADHFKKMMLKKIGIK